MKAKYFSASIIFGLIFPILSWGQCSELFVSMYVAGSGNNKAIEIYNPTGSPILLTGNYRISVYFNGATNPSISRELIGTIPAQSTFVLANGQKTIDSITTSTPHYATPPCDTALQRVSNQLDSAHAPAVCYFKGTDALSLDKLVSGNWGPVDIFACIGEYPTSLVDGKHYGWWDTAPYNNATSAQAWTKYHSLVRKQSVQQGTVNNPSPGTWNVSVEWDSLPNSHTGGNHYYPTGTYSSTCTTFSTSVLEVTKDNSVIVFPNPINNGALNITSNKPVKSIFIYNLFGELIRSQCMLSPARETRIDVGNIFRGIYVTKIILEGSGIFVSKIAIQ